MSSKPFWLESEEPGLESAGLLLELDLVLLLELLLSLEPGLGLSWLEPGLATAPLEGTTLQEKDHIGWAVVAGCLCWGRGQGA